MKQHWIAAAAWVMCAAWVMAAGPELIEPMPARPAAVPEEVSASAVAFRVRFGMKDIEPSDWSGQIDVSGAKLANLRGWHWFLGDSTKGNSWTLRTRHTPVVGQGPKHKPGPIGDAGIVITLDDVTPEAKVDIKTPAGAFSFNAADVQYGAGAKALDGAVEIERVPPVVSAAQTAADEDYPAAVQAKDGTAYVVYLAFARGKDFPGERERVSAFGVAPANPALGAWPVRKIESPKDLDYLREPAGGERLYLRAIKDGKWSVPVALTDNSLEMYRPAVAIDGSGKVWVFYSAHLNPDADLDYGNWELMARGYEPASGKIGEAIDISNAPGTDFMPAAVSDSAGKVWVTWVGQRGEHFNVFTSHQTERDKFTPGVRLTDSAANEWEPAIAADPHGAVTIAWDTYLKGDYDVYLARRERDRFSKPIPVAATLHFEVRPSMVYDSAGRLWIAWEQSGELWGKDFGALKKRGIPLYSGARALGMKVMDAAGNWFTPPGTERGAGDKDKANEAGLVRLPLRGGFVAPCYPRLAADDQGRIWLTFRARLAQDYYRTTVGSVWFEFVTRLEGDKWMPATWVPNSNNILDNRPAVLPAPDHSLMVFFSGDGRGELVPPHLLDQPTTEVSGSNAGSAAAAAAIEKRGITGDEGSYWAGGAKRIEGNGPDPNDDIFLAVVRPTDQAPGDVRLKAIAPAEPAKPGPDVEAERAIIKACRDYRVNLNGEPLRIWRGEFHRHTELSPDGGNDGGLLDLWRYTIDAVSLDWIGDGDHDYGNGREYSWWTTQKAVTLFTIPDHFTPMYCYERSVSYPEGHRNCMFARRGARSLPRLPMSPIDDPRPAPDTNLLYMYLHHFDGVCASHTSGTDMGTDWRNNDPAVEPFVEIYQGDRNNYERPDAPRSAVREAQMKQSTPEEESFGGYRPKGFVNLALLKGYRLAFESSSDHISTHLSFTNVYVTEPTRQGILDAIKKRRVYGSTADIIADVRVKADNVEHFMGEEFAMKDAPTLNIHLIGPLNFMNVTVIKDDQVVYSANPNQKDVSFTWTDPKPEPGKTSYYYVRGEQVPDVDGSTGELVWASPLWIKCEEK